MHRNLLVTNFFLTDSFYIWTHTDYMYIYLLLHCTSNMQIHLAQWIISFASLHFDVLTQVFQCELLCFRHVETSIDD